MYAFIPYQPASPVVFFLPPNAKASESNYICIIEATGFNQLSPFLCSSLHHIHLLAFYGSVPATVAGLLSFAHFVPSLLLY